MTAPRELPCILSAAWRPRTGVPGPMALRRRLTAVLPLSRMARLTRFVPIRGKVPETVYREHPRTVTPKT
jgi:hypothetical protein